MREWYKMKAQGKTAEILIYDVIGESWDGSGVPAKKFVEDLAALGDVSSITVRINSPGGDVFDGTAIYNALVGHPARIETQIDGMALSMASVIAMAGDTVTAPENVMIMVHDPSTFAYGNATDMRKIADTLDKAKTSLLVAYRRKTGKTEEELSAMLEAETWMTGKEAKDAGFVDVVLEPVRLAARFDLSKFGYQHTPKADSQIDIPPEPAGRKVALERMRIETRELNFGTR